MNSHILDVHVRLQARKSQFRQEPRTKIEDFP